MQSQDTTAIILFVLLSAHVRTHTHFPDFQISNFLIDA